MKGTIYGNRLPKVMQVKNSLETTDGKVTSIRRWGLAGQVECKGFQKLYAL
jgi:hypothetical protein